MAGVSVPYSRVTNQSVINNEAAYIQFPSPIVGSQTDEYEITIYDGNKFPSPIVGSQTNQPISKGGCRSCFRPL